MVADFRAKTEELFHSLDGQSADDIEKTVYAYVQSQIDEYGLDAKIVDVVVAGSRCRGIEQENSDLDVVVEYTGSTREDDLFNMLHEDSIYIAGIQVDINPIQRAEPEHWRLIFQRWKLTCRRRHSRSRSIHSL